MCSGQDGLRISTLPFEGLKDGLKLFSYFCIFVDFYLEVLKDLGINHACDFGHRDGLRDYMMVGDGG